MIKLAQVVLGLITLLGFAANQLKNLQKFAPSLLPYYFNKYSFTTENILKI